MAISRRTSRPVAVGDRVIGGDAPISVQTMVKAPAEAVDDILAQIAEAAVAGCDIVRMALPNRRAIPFFAEVTRRCPLPMVADIHFDAALAVAALEAGAHKIRINPGNMKDWDAIHEVIDCARNRGAAIRIGVNAGSVGVAPDETETIPTRLADTALEYAERFEARGFRDIVLSLKASDAPATIAANMAVAERCDYPLHIGVTEAGPEEEAMLKSAVGIGGLVAQGVGDTVRVSFTGPPVREVVAAKAILRAAGALHDRPELISCPTCGRCRVDLRNMVERVRDGLRDVAAPITVAVMGCEVNGPGEASHADVGIAAGTGSYTLFREGRKVASVPEADALGRLLAEVEQMCAQRSGAGQASGSSA